MSNDGVLKTHIDTYINEMEIKQSLACFRVQANVHVLCSAPSKALLLGAGCGRGIGPTAV